MVTGNYEKAMQVFDRMMDAYKNGNIDAKPSKAVFGSLLEALRFALPPNAGEKADIALKQMSKEFKIMPIMIKMTNFVNMQQKFQPGFC